jgi:hypothetical protein
VEHLWNICGTFVEHMPKASGNICGTFVEHESDFVHRFMLEHGHSHLNSVEEFVEHWWNMHSLLHK